MRFVLLVCCLADSQLGSEPRDLYVEHLEVAITERQKMGFAWERDDIRLVAWSLCEDGQFHIVDCVDVPRIPTWSNGRCCYATIRHQLWRIWFATASRSWTKENSVLDMDPDYCEGTWRRRVFW